MRTCIVMLMVLVLTGSALAQDLGSSRGLPVKNAPIVIYEQPAIPRQGGDTIEDATVIPSLPFTDTGTTAGYNNDYDEVCPFDSGSPDVVFSFTPVSDKIINVDLCGSAYDTKTYIYNQALLVIACNDDFYFDDVCGVYASKIEYLEVLGGGTYYIVVDGAGNDSGAYVIDVTEYEPCPSPCLADAVDEGEPELHYGYLDAYNGGCGSPEFGNPFQDIDWINVEGGNTYDGYAWLCGVSGWYIGVSGGYNRDTDWYRVFALQTGVIEFTVEAEFPCYMFKLAPLDCENVAVELLATADCEAPATLSFPVTVGEEVWLWVGPTTFTGPVTEFTYFMTVSNNTFDTVPAEGMSWGGVKAIYR